MASIVIHFSCLHPHFPPFSPISPHFPPFFPGHVAQFTPPPQPPRARGKFFWGVLAQRYPHFSTKKNCKFSQEVPFSPIFPTWSNFPTALPAHFWQRVIRGPAYWQQRMTPTNRKCRQKGFRKLSLFQSFQVPLKSLQTAILRLSERGGGGAWTWLHSLAAAMIPTGARVPTLATIDGPNPSQSPGKVFRKSQIFENFQVPLINLQKAIWGRLGAHGPSYMHQAVTTWVPMGARVPIGTR